MVLGIKAKIALVQSVGNQTVSDMCASGMFLGRCQLLLQEAKLLLLWGRGTRLLKVKRALANAEGGFTHFAAKLVKEQAGSLAWPAGLWLLLSSGTCEQQASGSLWALPEETGWP